MCGERGRREGTPWLLAVCTLRSQAEEAYEEAEKLYKEVNEKVHEELPNFYDRWD